MKKILVLLIITFGSLSSYAQDPQLLENEWYLSQLIVNGETLYPPNEAQELTLYFEFEGSGLFTVVCSSVSGDPINYDSNNDFFTITGFFIFGNDCTTYPGIVFQDTYFYEFFIHSPEGGHVFSYVIENGENETKSLTLTNEFGDIAVYSNVLLSSQDFNISTINIYPNPTKAILNIKSQIPIKNIKIYNVLGKLVLEQENNPQTIDISKLENGLLFVQLETEQGVLVKKVMKL